MKNRILLCFLLFTYFATFSQIPQDYYSAAQGKIQEDLKTALSDIVTAGHTSNTYASLWAHFQKTDKHPSGYVWDMYSNCSFQFVTDQCGNYTLECDCYNREHSVPVSWMGGGTPFPMYADLHHIVPVDALTNNKRANFPFGRVGNASWTSLNGSKLGTSNFPGYAGTAFEPINNYKGDFARIMFYMVTRYENLLSSWQSNDISASAVLDGTIWPAFTPWAKELYLQWHEQDPVDQKEMMRNDSIFSIQNNRNPFIDHPEFARQIWGPDASAGVFRLADLTVYPNPAQQEVTVSSGFPSLDGFILDISGRIIMPFSFETSTATLDISSLAAGIYLIQTYWNHQIQTMYLLKR